MQTPCAQPSPVEPDATERRADGGAVQLPTDPDELERLDAARRADTEREQVVRRG